MRSELELTCLRKALELLPDLPGGPQLSVNLSAPLLVDERTVEILDARADISNLIVEVTEDVLVRQGPEIERAARALRAARVSRSATSAPDTRGSVSSPR